MCRRGVEAEPVVSSARNDFKFSFRAVISEVGYSDPGGKEGAKRSKTRTADSATSHVRLLRLARGETMLTLVPILIG